MKFNISPGMIIFILGFGGLVFSLAENSGGIGGKIPLSTFFIIIICLGIVLEIYLKRNPGDTFGEMEGSRGFG